MIEKIIFLKNVEIISFYGVKDVNLKTIRNLFPRVKIIAKGEEIKIKGEKNEIENFKKKFFLFIKHLNLYNSIKPSDIESIFFNKEKNTDFEYSDNKNILLFGKNGKTIKARTLNQNLMVKNSSKNDMLFAVGVAGTGKTYMAIALAVKALKNKEIKKIVLSRPAVETGEQLGFLPGDLKEKLDPYLQPLYDALREMIPTKKLNEYFNDGIIQIAPLAFMRGRTLSNSFVILDEAQNSTLNQMKMFLTRMGENSKFIITGDITQIDLRKKSNSGLLQSLKILKNIEGISIINFDEKDIIRHQLVKKIVKAYENK